jgi:uncharacterized protein YjbI with pentapeptide repeats
LHESKDIRDTFLCYVDFGETVFPRRRLKIINTKFDNAKLYGAHFPHDVEVDNVSFNDAELRNIDLVCAKLQNVTFWDAKLLYVDFWHSELKGVNFSLSIKNMIESVTELIQVDFSDAKLENVGFRGTPLDGYTYEEIVRPGRSLELTQRKPKDNEDN